MLSCQSLPHLGGKHRTGQKWIDASSGMGAPQHWLWVVCQWELGTSMWEGGMAPTGWAGQS